MNKLSRYELNNGIRVIIEELKDVKSVSIGLCIATGARFEDNNNLGISHFIEHMLFKGTKKRTTKQIAEEIDKVGGKMNATTSKEITLYYVKVLNKHLDLALDILQDMLFNSLFSETEIEKEKIVVLEEINRLWDTPEELVHDLFTENIWAGSELAESVLGKISTVQNFTRDSILDFFKKNYLTQNIIISVAGGINTHSTLEKIKDLFNTYPYSGTPRQIITPSPNKKKIKIYNRDLEQLHICIGTVGLSKTDKLRYVISVIDSILGGGMSSWLFQEVREKRSLAYSVGTYHLSFKDTGHFVAYAGTTPKNYDQLVETIIKEFSKLREGKIEEAEVAKAKEQIVGSLILSLENTFNRMVHLAESEVYFQRLVPLDEVIKGINQVTKKEVIELAWEIFNPENINIVGIGPK
jgi:predicted Zn-dependent peptidase